MTTFDDREHAFEAKYAHDEELRFKVNNRRNKMLGLWVANQLGKSGAEAEAYAKQVVLADFEQPGYEDVLHKLLKDVKEQGASLTREEICAQAEALLPQARREIMAE